jgi:hypothetical protein
VIAARQEDREIEDGGTGTSHEGIPRFGVIR